MTSPLPDGERDESLEAIRRDEESATRPAELFYPNVAEFVADRFIYFVPRPTPESGRVWCPSWYAHAQALSRLDSLWRAWETLRWDGALGMSNLVAPPCRPASERPDGPGHGTVRRVRRRPSQE